MLHLLLNKMILGTTLLMLANNSSDGDVGVIGNEPANLQCGVIPYTM